ncbi:50S ribosomal protein L29 [Candidatus Uhrbacteria bacterium]|nr:50S ribosomal protein L29 [Candidatus Uhrbacteria bacterium]
MDIKTLRSKTKEALMTELSQAQTHLKSLDFKLAANQLKNVRESRKTKHMIARLQTLINEKQKISEPQV